MRQGSGFDDKHGYDFTEGDWSVRVEPLGLWCAIHAYYDCPECNPAQSELQLPVVSAPPEALQLPMLLAPPSLKEQVSTILAPIPGSMVSSLLGEERFVDALRRGRLIHERALELAQTQRFSYDEAIARLLEER